MKNRTAASRLQLPPLSVRRSPEKPERKEGWIKKGKGWTEVVCRAGKYRTWLFTGDRKDQIPELALLKSRDAYLISSITCNTGVSLQDYTS